MMEHANETKKGIDWGYVFVVTAMTVVIAMVAIGALYWAIGILYVIFGWG